MESLLKNFFPPNRLTIFPPEDHLEPFIYIIHFLCSRHFDFGVEFVLNLMSLTGEACYCYSCRPSLLQSRGTRRIRPCLAV